MVLNAIEANPLVSVIMPAYNSGAFILSAINSVLNQTYQNFELLIIDDCSTDNTVELVSTLNDSRIKLFSLENNSGSPAKPRNLGLSLCSGQFIAFLDSDDLWMATKLEKQIKFMLINGLDFTCTNYNVIDQYGNYLNSFQPLPFVDYDKLLKNNSVGCLTAIVSKRLIDGSFFPSCGHEDYALWLKLLRKIDGVYSVNENLASYRKYPGSVSSRKLKLIPFFWNIYKNEEGFNSLMSLYYCFRYLFFVTWFKYK